MNDPLIRLSNVTKSYHGANAEILAVNDVSAEISAGEMVAVYGPSGSGKSTLLLVAGALLHPDGGRVQVCGQDPYQLTADERSRFRSAHIGYIFQQFHLLPYLDVLDNVLVVALAQEISNARARAMELLDRFGLTERIGHRPSALSVGEQQRVAAARALLANPSVILADEPTGNLDEDNGAILVEALASCAADGRAVLIVTHNAQVRDHAHRSIALREGRAAAEVLDDP